MPVNCPAAMRRSMSTSTGVLAVGARDPLEADQLGVADGADHCGYLASSGATLRTSTASSAAASPPSAVVIVM